MIYTKEVLRSKAHKELYEVIKKLSHQEKLRIPENVIKNIQKTMDKEYAWEYDDTKKLEEQNFLVETKALIVEMYERYLCPEDKKEFWNKYDRICLNMIEENKKEAYNPDNIFESRHIIKEEIKDTNLPEKIKKESLFKRLINKLRDYFIRKI